MKTIHKNMMRIASAVIIAAVAIFGFGGSAGAATGTTGPHQSGLVSCISRGSTFSGGYHMQAHAPTMKAYNYTAGVDRQTVEFTPAVFRWNGSAWVFAFYGESLTGTASDTNGPTTWYSKRTGAKWGNGTEQFKLAPSNYYAVAYVMNWYYVNPISAMSPKLSGSDYLWSAGYRLQSPMAGPTTVGYCTT